jgi:hypothetical protein
MNKPVFSIKAIAKNATILNILLLFSLVILLNYIVFPLLKIHVSYNMPVRNRPNLNDLTTSPRKINLPSLQDYTIVSNNNLFHPDRIIPPEKKEEKPLPKPDFVLYGTLITDTVKIAYMEDLKEPRSTPSRGKRITPLKQDDVLSGFTLTKIDADRVVLVRGDEKMDISISDSHRRAKSGPLSKQQPSPPIHPTRPERSSSSRKIDQQVSDFFQKRK